MEQRESFRGEVLLWQLRSQHPARIFNLTRLRPDIFEDPLDWLVSNTALRDSKHLGAAKRLLIFLFICAQGASMRLAAEVFQHSLATISSAFHKSLNAVTHLYGDVVALSDGSSPPEIHDNPKRFPFFDGAVGAIDGTYILCSVRRTGKSKEQSNSWRNRKGFISQNVLAVCDFKLNFQYVLPGWEGSAHDGRVFRSALDCGLRLPPGCYLLADAGYPPSHPLLLTPYMKV